MTDLAPEIIDRVTLCFMHMTTDLAKGDLALLASEANWLADYLTGLLAPPDPYADKTLRPGLGSASQLSTASASALTTASATKSSGDPTFDPTLPKDVA